ncbi:PREDICTED: uncharacterized protein LOC109324194 [Crocodylus porosus]|uniref:uncharacterized protein LOC109324194 n=1 Tax=Crocodylus porosus TaxID=8502 RepID=UPI000939EC3C|nr:PREDICTED: uncharacterized protein LOC109324194 [Crocodylus porosus]
MHQRSHCGQTDLPNLPPWTRSPTPPGQTDLLTPSGRTDTLKPTPWRDDVRTPIPLPMWMDVRPSTQDKHISPGPLPTPPGTDGRPCRARRPSGTSHPPCPTQRLWAPARGMDRRALAGPSRSIQPELKVEASRALQALQRWVLAPGLGGSSVPLAPCAWCRQGQVWPWALPPQRSPDPAPSRAPHASHQDCWCHGEAPGSGSAAHSRSTPVPRCGGLLPPPSTLPALGQLGPCLLPEGSPQCQNAAASGVGLAAGERGEAAVPQGWGARDVARARREDGRLHLESSLSRPGLPGRAPLRSQCPLIHWVVLGWAECQAGRSWGLQPAPARRAAGSAVPSVLELRAAVPRPEAGWQWQRSGPCEWASPCRHKRLRWEPPAPQHPPGSKDHTVPARPGSMAWPAPALPCREMARPGLTRAGRCSSWEALVPPSAHDGLQPAPPHAAGTSHGVCREVVQVAPEP